MYTRYNPASDEGALADELIPMALEEIVTDRGEKVRVSFSDGTNVMVNSATTIRFPKRFQTDGREIYLDGEAYFEIGRASCRERVEIRVMGVVVKKYL